ncbi:hypothetical protein [Moorena sp. SIO3I6]|nr:hypothetical protein [Moorena sp. SIO3I6]NEP28421.1 hypothetical protein [Moorena sp. SIO3I6]
MVINSRVRSLLAEAEAFGHALRTLHRVAAQWARIPCSRFLYDGAIGET